MKFEIHFEFRASLRKFQDLNFWDATLAGGPGVSQSLDWVGCVLGGGLIAHRRDTTAADPPRVASRVFSASNPGKKPVQTVRLHLLVA
jgi:hypothetical protein